ncbi:MAG: ATP-binding cassette domain-containing protein [Oscillospiraceae bacterium]|jgi:Fe-S cluster assembly ATP-binding protein|nr:ATP-binding cassette domain-containing protein [Oscillospiraceae bacterium]
MLELKNVCVAASDSVDVEIIYNVNLKLADKKIYVMTGPNGGGKTSLAKAIMGIYPVSGGELLLDGEDIVGKTITERANLGIGYAFQTPMRFKGLKVRELLTIAARNNNETTLYSMLIDVGLCAQDYIDRELNASFSGGELKRVEIASILARTMRVALFDEPEAGIDLWSFQKLTETFRKLNETSDATIIIISHQERILRLADEVILIAGGKVAEITSPDRFLNEIVCQDPYCYCQGCTDKEVVLC